MRINRNSFRSSTRDKISHSRVRGNWPLRRRSTIELAGLFLLVIAIAVVGSRTNAVNSRSINDQPAAASSKSSDVNLQVSQDPTPNTDTPNSSNPSSTTSPSSTSTSISSSSNSGSGTTQVSVNGQPVKVPSNGSINETVGNTTLQLSNSQSTTGSATNLNDVTTSNNVSDSSSLNSVNIEENQQGQ